MRLRKQLFFLSLITLALPWVGCQYIREMDSALREGQSQSLQATAKAVSTHIGNDASLLGTLLPFKGSAPPLFAHTLQFPISIDGYADDWFSQQLGFNAVLGDKNTGVISGIWKNSLHLFIKIKQSDIRYFNPSEKDLRHCDHIIIHTAQRSYALYASAPGQLASRRLGQNGEITMEHQLNGHWLEWEKGYQIEISLPLSWANAGLNIEVARANKSRADEITLQPLIRHNPELSQELALFASDNTKLTAVTHTGYILAQAGSTQENDQATRQHGLIEWFYRLALRTQQFPDYPTKFPKGLFQDDTVKDALAGQNSASWYQQGNKRFVRASLPIHNSSANDPIGAVVIEQSGHSLTNVTNNAFSRLLIYSFLASSLAALCLVVYATWLSIRIRKLSEAAANAVSESGKITDQFPVSKSADEIGELSRSYAHLLSRLREYTNYLRTLSSKLSHELRTPLAIVRSSLDNLEHESLNEQAKVYAERAIEGTSRLSNILNAMSAASRVEQAIDGAEVENIPCDELLTSLKAAYQDVYRKVRFSLNIQPDGAKGLFINASGELLVQALDKLVDNAADFCPENGLVELGLYRRNDTVIFTVRNEGPLLPSHMHGQLFDSMVSVRDKNSADNGHHLGLGLYIVRLITDFHQGEVQAYNVPDNSGVIFEIAIPSS